MNKSVEFRCVSDADEATVGRKKSLPLSRSIVLSQEQTRRHDCTSHRDSLDSLSPAAGCLISLGDEEDNRGPRERKRKRRGGGERGG